MAHRVMFVTAIDGVDHQVTPEEMTAGVVAGCGVYRTVAGEWVTTAAMTSAPGRLCWACAAVERAAQSQPGLPAACVPWWGRRVMGVVRRWVWWSWWCAPVVCLTAPAQTDHRVEGTADRPGRLDCRPVWSAVSCSSQARPADRGPGWVGRRAGRRRLITGHRPPAPAGSAVSGAARVPPVVPPVPASRGYAMTTTSMAAAVLPAPNTRRNGTARGAR
jgi:hypothetical protein